MCFYQSYLWEPPQLMEWLLRGKGRMGVSKDDGSSQGKKLKVTWKVKLTHQLLGWAFQQSFSLPFHQPLDFFHNNFIFMSQGPHLDAFHPEGYTILLYMLSHKLSLHTQFSPVSLLKFYLFTYWQ